MVLAAEPGAGRSGDPTSPCIRVEPAPPYAKALASLLILACSIQMLACDPPRGVVDYTHTARQFGLVAKGDASGLRITVTPTAPWKMNLDYPYASTTTRDGVDIAGAAEELSEARLVFVQTGFSREVLIEAEPLVVRTRFAVCIDDLCKPIDYRFEIRAD